MNVINFPRPLAKIDLLIKHFIADNKSIIIGTSYLKLRLMELQDKFPEARFEICGVGVKLCQKKS